MTQTIIALIITAIAVAIVIRYIWLEFNNPCRGCNKRCDRRKR